MVMAARPGLDRRLRRWAQLRVAEPWLTIVGLAGFGYLAVLANLTLWRSGTGVGLHANLVPFRTVARCLAGPHRLRGLQALGGGLARLAPLGLLLAVASRIRGRWAACTLAGTSLLIEAWQWAAVSGRSADVDDVLLNTVGGLLAYAGGLAALAGLARVVPAVVESARTVARPAPATSRIEQA